MEKESQKAVNESQKEKDDQINEFILELYDEALSDGVVSKEELILIREIVMRLHEYTKAVSKAFEDTKLATEKTKKLEIIQAGVLRSVSSKALDDGNITPDEWKLIKKLVDYFDEQIAGFKT